MDCLGGFVLPHLYTAVVAPPAGTYIAATTVSFPFNYWKRALVNLNSGVFSTQIVLRFSSIPYFVEATFALV
jgi:hypothetical protein